MVDITFRRARRNERVRKVSPVQNRRGAEKYEREVREAMLDGTWAVADVEDRKEEVPTLGDWAEDFIRQHSVPKGLAPTSILSQRRDFRLHLLPTIGASTRVDVIGRRHFLAVRGAMTEQGLSPKTINNALGTLSKALKFYYESRELTCPTFGNVRCKVPKSPPKFWEPGEYDRLIASAKTPEELAVVLLMGDCGLRCGEVIALEWSHARRDPKPQLVIQRSFTRGHFGPPKSSRPRTVAMTSRVVAALEDLPRSIRGRWVIPRAIGSDEHSTHNALSSVVAKVERAAGFGKPRHGSLHKLRHTYITRLAAAGVPPRHIMELAGHTHLTTTLRYMHVVSGGTERAMEALEAFDQSRQHGGSTQTQTGKTAS
jgi:integrase